MPHTRKQKQLEKPLVNAAAEYLDAGNQMQAEVRETLNEEAELVIHMEVTAPAEAGFPAPIPNRDPDSHPG